MTVTIKDIANKCQVSTAVASAALRSKKGTISYSKETQERIQKAAKEMGYAPNQLAQTLRSGKNNSIALMFNLGGPHNPSEVPRMISKLFWDNHGKASFMSSINAETVDALLASYFQQCIQGVALEWSYSMSKAKDVPFKLLEKFTAPVLIAPQKYDLNIDQIIWTRGEAIKASVEHFIKTGRKKPGLLMSENSNAQKVKAFDEAMRKHGLEPEKHHICPANNKLAEPDECYKTLKEQFPSGKFPFDSIICGNDELAIAAIYWLNEKGYRIPGDVAVIGYNNSPTAQFLTPPLASAERKHKEVSEIIYRLISSRIENPGLPKRKVHIPMEFVWRKSAG